MKVRCTRTSIEYTASGYNDFYIESIHPLFSASYEVLLEVSKDWRRGKLSEGERRVLFVSLLSSTNLLNFRCPAEPEDATVLKYMEPVIATTNWINAIGERIPLSKIAINASTASLKNVGSWLSNWNNTQREYTISSHMQAVRDKIAASQKKLTSMLTTGTTPHGKSLEENDLYVKHLAKWFMIAAAVPRDWQEAWTEIFLMKRPAIWNARLIDLVEMKEHFEENINLFDPNAKITIAGACYRHICGLLTDREEGILGALGHNKDAPSYTIVHEETEATNIDIAAAKAGVVEPVERNYPTKTAYLIARARWRLREVSIRNAFSKEESLPSLPSTTISLESEL